MSATGDRIAVMKQLREVFDRVTDGRVPESNIREEAHILDDLGLSSLELLELRFELETVWNITLDDAEAQKLRTVKDVVDLIVARSVP